MSREEIAEALERVVDTRHFSIGDRDSVRRALHGYRSAPGDFADYLIGERNRRAGCRTTKTFDEALAGSALFEEP
jgi:predicted nucleic-acid-binding protein